MVFVLYTDGRIRWLPHQRNSCPGNRHVVARDNFSLSQQLHFFFTFGPEKGCVVSLRFFQYFQTKAGNFSLATTAYDIADYVSLRCIFGCRRMGYKTRSHVPPAVVYRQHSQYITHSLTVMITYIMPCTNETTAPSEMGK